MQHRIGRSAGGHHQADRVLYRFTRDDLPRQDLLADGVDQHLGRGSGGLGLLRVRRSHLRGSEQAHAQGLEGRGHGVGGEHAAAGAHRGASVFLDADKILLVHFAGRVGADRLERADDGEVLALPLARLDGACVDEYAGHIHARDRHNGSRHVLVAAAADQHAIHGLAVDRSLDAVGDHFARNQAVLHRLCAHADAVGNGGNAEYLRLRAFGLERRHGAVHQRLDACIAGVHGRMAVGHADDGLAEIAVAKSDGAQHGAVGRAGHALGDQAASAVIRHDALLGFSQCQILVDAADDITGSCRRQPSMAPPATRTKPAA